MFKNSVIIMCSLLFTSFGFSSEAAKVEINLEDLLSSPEKYLDMTVNTIGTVDHVCKHGGKKMIIFSKTPDDGIHVMASEKVPVFNAEMNGSDVQVLGVVKENRITKAQVLKFLADREVDEAKVLPESSNKAVEGCNHEGEGKADHKAGTEKKAEHPLLAQMEASGKDYVSDYYIECIELSLKK